MKMIKHIYNNLLILSLLLLFTMTSCELDEVEPELNTAPGGGTLITYKAYAISATTADDVHGRVVFWKGNGGVTLIQISLNETDGDISYTTGIYTGKADETSEERLMALYAINGTTGEFSTHKYYVVNDPNYYNTLSALNGHIKIIVSDQVVAAGDIGANAEPVAEGD